MNDPYSTISDLKQVMKTFVDERNWKAYHHPKELAIALSIESNELLELFLFEDKKFEEIQADQKLIQSITEEVADIFAYLISMVNTLELDLTTAFLEKMKKNRLKYPVSQFHGNYTKK